MLFLEEQLFQFYSNNRIKYIQKKLLCFCSDIGVVFLPFRFCSIAFCCWQMRERQEQEREYMCVYSILDLMGMWNIQGYLENDNSFMEYTYIRIYIQNRIHPEIGILPSVYFHKSTDEMKLICALLQHPKWKSDDSSKNTIPFFPMSRVWSLMAPAR